MRKSGKRKASQREEAKQDNREEAKATTPRQKRVKASQPQSEPTEYLEDPRNLEDLWKAAFPVGTEWDELDKVYQYKWNFLNLEQAFEEGGRLHGIGNNSVYLFGATEPLSPSDSSLIPVLVAVVSPRPPSEQIAVTSVQRAAEEIIPMKQMKMDWIPYIPLENRGSLVIERIKSPAQIFVLGCIQRRAALKHMKIYRLMKFQYCLPYLRKIKEDEVEQATVVQILFSQEPTPVVCEFDWELDEVEEFIDQLINNKELSADQEDAFKDYIKEEVREAKRKAREERRAREARIQGMSQEERAAIENMKKYKFYPVQTLDTPVIVNKSTYINRYYTHAHEVL